MTGSTGGGKHGGGTRASRRNFGGHMENFMGTDYWVSPSGSYMPIY